MTFRAIDLFSGAGGSSSGARAARVEIVGAFDRWDLACKTYRDNFPGVEIKEGDLRDQEPRRLVRQFGKVDLILASPECTSHSIARGRRRRSESSRASALQVIRFAEAFAPRWIIIENVVRMRNWRHYAPFLRRLRNLGYHVSEQPLNAADFGVPQRRRRLFILCDLEGDPPLVQPTVDHHQAALTAIDSNGHYAFKPLFTPARAVPTIERAKRAMDELGANQAFLLVYYGSDYAGGWQRLDVPLRTITTLDRFALVRPARGGHVMRMLQVPELKSAMGLPPTFKLKHGSRRDQIKLLGNALSALL